MEVVQKVFDKKVEKENRKKAKREERNRGFVEDLEEEHIPQHPSSKNKDQ